MEVSSWDTMNEEENEAEILGTRWIGQIISACSCIELNT